MAGGTALPWCYGSRGATLINGTAMDWRTNQSYSMKTLITYLVEDNTIVLNNLIDTLRETADVKVTAHSATQAEASRWLDLHDGDWHLAIVDLFLKEGSGLGILAGCRHRKPYQKIVVLTNYATPEIRQRSATLGADAVFDKSTELDELIGYCSGLAAKFQRQPLPGGQGSVARPNPANRLH
jgi:two-component system OmpR family response regulator